MIREQLKKDFDFEIQKFKNKEIKTIEDNIKTQYNKKFNDLFTQLKNREMNYQLLKKNKLKQTDYMIQNQRDIHQLETKFLYK